MKQLIFSFAVALVLAGCGSAGSDDEKCNTQYSSPSTQVGASGLVLEPAQGMYATFPQIESFYQQVQSCMGVSATGPIVRYLSFRDNNMVGLAIYTIGLQTVYVNTDAIRDCTVDKNVLKHEFVHHLLWASGTSYEDNLAHNSPFFGLCVN